MKKKMLAAVFTVFAAALTLTACGGSDSSADNASASAKYTVGIVQLTEHPALDAATEGFKAALSDKLGEDVAVEFSNAQNNPDTCSTIVNGYLSNGIDLIMANATPALQAAAAATDSVPILGTSITEYGVALELENFSGTVGGNISGASDLASLTDQAASFQEWFPDVKKVGLLYCSAEPNSMYQIDVMTSELSAKGYECTPYSFSDSNDLSAVVTTAAEECDAIYIPTDNTAANNTGIIDNICRPAGVPIFAGEQGICNGCGVATLSISYYDLGYTTGEMAAKILTGEADISEMPIEYAPAAKKFNQAICDDLKLTVPSGYEAIAD